MDLGCLDLGCISLLEKCNTNDNAPVDRSPKEDNDSSRSGKNKSPKETSPTSLSALNKIKKPPRRKGSPIGWFPRKKMEPYLKRKIKLLQEVNGMNSTLDETLGDSCPHYSRVKREQIAAREAALKAIEARKAAMVEASWCRILRAARIQIKEAEDILINAEKVATEAFEAATSMGVIMYDAPNYPRKSCKIRSSSNNGGGFTTHAIAASFETAFEVDKEVAAAVKTAFTQLANCPSVDKDEFKELLRKISQNPDVGGNRPELSDFSSEYESDTGSELEPDVQNNDAVSQDSTFRTLNDSAKKGSARKRQICKDLSMNKLVEMMLGRLKCLHDDELESLATIVATCGLSAALAEVETDRRQESLNFARRMSSIGPKFAMNSQVECFMDGKAGQKQADSELPSLDKFLVKHMSKLEREVLEAKTKRQNEVAEGAERNTHKIDKSSIALPETTPDLGSVLVKHSSKFEKEIEEAKRNNGKTYENVKKKSSRLQTEVEGHCQPEIPSLDKFLVKHLSRLEREVQEAKNRKESEMKEGSADESNSNSQAVEKENVDLNLNKEKNEPDAMKENENSLEKILVKPVHKLEREKMQASAWEKDHGILLQRHQKRQGGSNVPDCESLDKVLVKHVSRLEKEKMEFNSRQNELVMKGKKNGGYVQQEKNGEEGGLDQILIKHNSRLEREKIASFTKEQTEDQPRAFVSRREAREREMQEAWGGLSLGNSVKPHLSRLERDKAAWIKAEEEEKRLAMKQAS